MTNERMKLLNCTLGLVAGASLPVSALAAPQPAQEQTEKQPNIILIVADDLGYGDLSCYGAHRIQTPGMDRIANEGIRFTQGFCTAATSTPSRYSVMTGKYPWSNVDAKILPGNAALIIDTQKITLPKLMKQAGYTTGSVGKWHIGLGDGHVDWNKEVHPGAAEIGYDYSFIQAATNDRVPCVFLENGRVVGLDPNDPLYVDYRKNFPGEPTGKENPELLRMHPSVGHAGSIVNGVPRIGFQKGGKAAQWKPHITGKAFCPLTEIKEIKDQHRTQHGINQTRFNERNNPMIDKRQRSKYNQRISPRDSINSIHKIIGIDNPCTCDQSHNYSPPGKSKQLPLIEHQAHRRKMKNKTKSL